MANVRQPDADSMTSLLRLVTDALIDAGQHRISDVLLDLLDSPACEETEAEPG